MADVIKLLPDHVANQIAAGEVIQRPASVVKELLENAIDAKATDIQLIIKNAGKTLISVIDDGVGMSDTDARLCVERHATSKIQQSEDLFNINTLGFRGEAMASIAAISHLEIISKRAEDEIGVRINIEGSEVKAQEPEVTSDGTKISVKNLFYNIPARRNFLKSDNVEYRHILEEFQRVVLVHPHISFSLYHNDELQFQLTESSLKKRIIDVFGDYLNKRIIPVESETTMSKIQGYIGKPEFAKKRRGEQYFFVNNRFIKHPYFHHAVVNAFDQLLPEGHHPTYFIYLKIPNDRIDINIHPTKTEVNFLDGKLIYTIIVSMIKQGIGKFNLSPSIDFDIDQTLLVHPESDTTKIKLPTIQIDPSYNPFNQDSAQPINRDSTRERNNIKNWETLYEDFDKQSQIEIEKDIDHHIGSNYQNKEGESVENDDFRREKNIEKESSLIQIANRYIVSGLKSGLMMIDQQAAHERILYEQILKRLEQREVSSQQELFPQHVSFSLKDAELVNELKEDLRNMGVYLESMSNTAFVIKGLPSDLSPKENASDFLDSLLESYKLNQTNLKTDKTINLALAMAKNMAVKHGVLLEKNEMQSIIDTLFACEVPDVSPSGKPTVIILSNDEINQKFNA